MDHSEIAAIVVTYNRLDLLRECLTALRAQTCNAFDILVVDNASTDGTDTFLAELEKNGTIRCFNTGKNLGGAGGFNYGIRKAFESGYEYYWLMDDDTIPKPTALEELLHASQALQGKYGFLYSYAEWVDGSICNMNGPSEIPGLPVVYDDSGNEIIPIKRGTFVSFFVSREIVRKIGLPIKEFFIWADDTNYCSRICKVLPGYWVTASRVVHKIKNNSEPNLVNDSVERLGRYVYYYRNRLYNARMNHAIPSYFWHILKRCGRILLSAKDHKWLRMRKMLQGVWQGFSFKPEIEHVSDK